jgi:ABC-2 type transport system ATP-binding protein
VLLLDEPANGLDPNARIEMRDLLLRLGSMGKTLIVTSHILPELSRICDQVAIITQGKLRAAGSLDQIMRKVRQRRVMEVELIKPEQVPAAAELLRELLEPAAEVRGSQQEGQVRFTTNSDDRKLSEVLQAAVSRGLSIAQYREVPMDLEDAFLEVTRGQSDPLAEPPPRLKAGSSRGDAAPAAPARTAPRTSRR